MSSYSNAMRLAWLSVVTRHKRWQLNYSTVVKDPDAQRHCGWLSSNIQTVKRLGITVSTDLKRKERVNATRSKAATSLHFLKQLKRAGVLHFYTAVPGAWVAYCMSSLALWSDRGSIGCSPTHSSRSCNALRCTHHLFWKYRQSLSAFFYSFLAFFSH